MNLFQNVKYGVSCREVAERYGVSVNRQGKALCPFHNDRHPSLYVADNHYFCVNTYKGVVKMASIRKRGQNSYLIVVSRGYDYEGNRLKAAQKTVHPPKDLTPGQCKKWLNEQAVLFEREVRHDPQPVNHAMTLAAYTEHWLRDIAPGKLAASTYSRDQQDISKEMCKLLKAWKQECAWQMEQAEGQTLTEEDYLFRQPSGDPMVPMTFTFRFKKILKENGLPQNLSVHSLRHTNASLLIAQGVDVRTVAGLLGHSQPSTTLDIYAHAFDKTKREAQEKLGKVMGL